MCTKINLLLALFRLLAALGSLVAHKSQVVIRLLSGSRLAVIRQLSGNCHSLIGREFVRSHRAHSDLNDQNSFHSTIDAPPGVPGVLKNPVGQTEDHSGELER